MKIKIYLGHHLLNGHRNQSNHGQLLFVSMIAIFPIIAPAGTVLPELDGFYHTLNILILRDKSLRTLTENSLHWCIRFIFYFLMFIDLSRAIAGGIVCFSLVGIRTVQILKFLSTYTGRLQNLVVKYSSLVILIETVRDELETLLYCVLYGSFWIVVVLTWLIVKCSLDELSLPIYMFLICGFIACLVMLSIIVPPLYMAASLAILAVKNQQTRANLLFVNGKSLNSREDKLRLKAVKPLVLRYGKFYKINRGFCVDFALTMAVRTCDAVLTFDP